MIHIIIQDSHGFYVLRTNDAPSWKPFTRGAAVGPRSGTLRKEGCIIDPVVVPTLYLEDLHIGQTFGSGESYELTEQNIIAFAREFDDQPFHTDVEAAKSTLFKGLAGSGWMVLSISMRLLNSSFRLAGGNIGVGGEIAWPNPSRPGQKLRAITEVVEITPSTSNPEQGKVKFRTETSDEDGHIVAVLVGTLLAIARPVELA